MLSEPDAYCTVNRQAYLLQCLVVNKACRILGYVELTLLDVFAEFPAQVSGSEKLSQSSSSVRIRRT